MQKGALFSEWLCSMLDGSGSPYDDGLLISQRGDRVSPEKRASIVLNSINRHQHQFIRIIALH